MTVKTRPFLLCILVVLSCNSGSSFVPMQTRLHRHQLSNQQKRLPISQDGAFNGNFQSKAAVTPDDFVAVATKLETKLVSPQVQEVAVTAASLVPPRVQELAVAATQLVPPRVQELAVTAVTWLVSNPFVIAYVGGKLLSTVFIGLYFFTA